MSSNELPIAFCGPFVHSLKKEAVTIVEEGLIIVQNGKITHLREGQPADIEKILGQGNYVLKRVEDGQFLCPGFVDLHTHAPQFPNQGLGVGLSLLEWLEQYTFPLETKYTDEEFAKKVYRAVVKNTLKAGTTTACYYGTIHTESTIHLATIASKLGQRCLVGKVNMDQNSPVSYKEETDNSIEETERFITAVRSLNNDLVEPIITPRFAIACSMKLLKALGNLASSNGVYVQTHISENENEIAFTKELFPQCSSYTDIYKTAGLLGNKTILAHGIYLSEEEQKIIASTGASIAHCPNSNILLKSGICDVRSLWRNKVKIGLGTDVAGGSAYSILDSMRSAVAVSVAKSFSTPQYEPLTFHEAFYMATLGGAEALNKADVIGNFAVGKSFDALVINMQQSQGDFDSGSHTFTDPQLSLLGKLQKLIFVGDSRNVAEVYINGCLVSKNE